MRRPRLKLRTLMIAVAACALGLALLPLISPVRFRRGYFTGYKTVPLRIAVVEEGTGRPIAGATVRVDQPGPSHLFPPSSGVTGADGSVTVDSFPAASGRVWTVGLETERPVVLRKTESLSFNGGKAEALMLGYEALEVDLTGDPSGSTITIRLRPASTSEDVSRSGR